MIIINDQRHYVVDTPEMGIYQDIDPSTGGPFLSEAAAQGWLDDYIAALDSDRVAQEASLAQAERDRLAAEVSLSIVANSIEVGVGAPVLFTATLKNGLDATIPITQSFAVPIESNGLVSRIKGVAFVNGVADVSITFDKSGYYQITEQGINSRLDGMYIHLAAPFEVTVFE